MDINEIEQRVAAIRAVAWDHERAHSLEDALYRDVLKAVTDLASPGANCGGCGRITVVQEWARAALKTREIEFERWCA